MQAITATRQPASRVASAHVAALSFRPRLPSLQGTRSRVGLLFSRHRTETAATYVWKLGGNAGASLSQSEDLGSQSIASMQRAATRAAGEEDGDYAGRDDEPVLEWHEAVLHRIQYHQGPPEGPGREREHYFRKLYNHHSPIDFRKLAKVAPEINERMVDNYFDTREPGNGPILTQVLLNKHFNGLKIQLPPDRLCPPIPNRQLYIVWLKDLLDSTGPLIDETAPATTERELVGMDIGTGASAVYPILGCAQRPWKFIATELDEKSFEWAWINLEKNGMLDRVNLVRRTKSYTEDLSPLIPLDELGIKRIDFVMTNPPFYESEEDMNQRMEEKEDAPVSTHTGAPVELWCEGGEVGFVKQMILESMLLRHRVQWYTAMLSSPQSVEVLLLELKRLDVRNTATTTFIPGKVTRRYALAWTFGDRRPAERAARGDKYTIHSKISRGLLSPATEHVVPLGSFMLPHELGASIAEYLRAVELPVFEWDDTNRKGYGFANEAVWSRAHRRKKQLAARDTSTNLVDSSAGGQADNTSHGVTNHSHALKAATGHEHKQASGASPPRKKAKMAEEPLPTTLPELERALEEALSTELPEANTELSAIKELIRLNDELRPDDPTIYGDKGRKYEYQYNDLMAKHFAARQRRARLIQARIAKLKNEQAGSAVIEDSTVSAAAETSQTSSVLPALQSADSTARRSPKRDTVQDTRPLKDRYKVGFSLEMETSLVQITLPKGDYATRPIVRDSRLKVRWLSGNDNIIYESLVGALNSKFGVREGGVEPATARSRQQTETMMMKTPKNRLKVENRPKREQLPQIRWPERMTRMEWEGEHHATGKYSSQKDGKGGTASF